MTFYKLQNIYGQYKEITKKLNNLYNTDGASSSLTANLEKKLREIVAPYRNKETGNLELTDEIKEAGVKEATMDGIQYYDYLEPINTIFWNAAVEASNHKGELKCFKSKVNHSADWDIKMVK